MNNLTAKCDAPLRSLGGFVTYQCNRPAKYDGKCGIHKKRDRAKEDRTYYEPREIELAETRTTVVTTTVYEVSDGPIWQPAYRDTPTRVTRVVVADTVKSDGQEDRVVTIDGWLLKMDGTQSARTLAATRYRGDWPDWVERIIEPQP